MTQAATTPTQLRAYLFGHFRLERAGEPIRLPTRKIEALFAYLALHPRQHSRAALSALIWPDVPDTSARASLRNALAVLRKQLGRDLLLADRQAVQLNPNVPLWVDATIFRAEASRFLEAPAPAASLVNLELYTADLLLDFYADWVLLEREALRTLYLETLLVYTQQMRAASEYERAIEVAKRALTSDPANERAHQHLMCCYMALGKRSAALRQFEACRDALDEQLAVEPSAATRKLHKWIEQAPADRLPIEASLTNLPIPLTSFVGRKRETAAVKRLLAGSRLLTLTGVGGSGKTRLAIHVATDLLDVYPDGVWWIELASLTDSALVPGTVAKALGVNEAPDQTMTETLVNFLRPRKLLLVLDNCEHLIGACAHLTENLLRDCPHLTVLATSRETLGVAGEQAWPVPALSAPDPEQAMDVEHLLAYEAVRLFVGRATAVRPDFTLTEQNARPVAAICRRLEGIPLAVELAAARANLLTVAQIAARLDDLFDLLTSGSRTALPRHRTLRAAIDWSYDLLSAEERMLLRRLSIFAGGWTLPAAEAVCAGEGLAASAVFDVLARLVDKSLVAMEPQGDVARYRLLQTIQQYGHDRLLAAGEHSLLRKRHLNYFLRLAEGARPHMGYFIADADADLWLGRLEPENDNLRAALRRSLEMGNNTPPLAGAGLLLAASLHWYWFARGDFSEGRAWLQQLLALDADVSTETLAQALLTAGYLACWQGEFAAGRAPLQQALALFQRLEDPPGVALALHGLGFVALGEGDAALSRTRFADALAEARDAGDKWVASFALHFLAIVLTYQGEYHLASSCFEEGNALLQQMGGHRQGLAFSLFHHARIARHQADYATARSRLTEAMRLFRQVGDRRGVGYVLTGFVILLAAEGHHLSAARLAGAVASLQVVLGPFLEAPLQFEYDEELAVVRAALGEQRFADAWEKGRALNMERAIANALAGATA